MIGKRNLTLVVRLWVRALAKAQDTIMVGVTEWCMSQEPNTVNPHILKGASPCLCKTTKVTTLSSMDPMKMSRMIIRQTF